GSFRDPVEYNLPGYGADRGFEMVADISMRAADHPVGTMPKQMPFKGDSKERVQMLRLPAICHVAEQEQERLAVKLSVFDDRRLVCADHHVLDYRRWNRAKTTRT